MKRHLYVIPNDADLRKARIKERWLEAIILACAGLGLLPGRFTRQLSSRPLERAGKGLLMASANEWHDKVHEHSDQMLKDHIAATSDHDREIILIQAYWRLHSIAVQAIHDLDDEHGKKYQKALADLKALAF